MRHRLNQNSFVSNRRIFLSQCIDHGVSLGFGLFLFFVALSLVQSPALETLSAAGPSFWLSFLSILFFAGFLHRAFFLMVLGSTLGNLCFRIRPARPVEHKAFWFELALESLQPAMPALWLLEHILRNQRSRYPGIRYTLHLS